MPEEVENSAPRETVSAFGNLRAGINTAGNGGGASMPDGGITTPSTAPVTEAPKADNSSIVAAPVAAEKPAKAEVPLIGKPTETVLIDDRKPPPVAPKPEEPAVEEAKPDASEPDTDEKPKATELDLDTWKKQAEKFGYEIDPSGRVYNQERAKFRREKQEAREQLTQERTRVFAEIDAKFNELSAQAAPLLAFKSAVDAGDFDAIAQSIGHKDWAALQGEAVTQAHDPAYKRLRQLEREKEAEKEQQRRYVEQQRQQQEAQQRAEAVKAYKVQLVKQLETSQDPLAKALSWDPIFTNEVTAMQQKHWLEKGAPLSVEQIIRHDMNGTATYFRKMYDALKTVFGGKEAPTVAEKTTEEKPAAAAKPAPAAPTRPSIVQVPTSGSITPGAAQLPNPQSDDWFSYWGRVAQEREAEAKRSAKGGKS